MDEYSPKRHDIAQLKFLCEPCIMTVLQTWKRATMAGLMTQPLLSIFSLMN